MTIVNPFDGLAQLYCCIIGVVDFGTDRRCRQHSPGRPIGRVEARIAQSEIEIEAADKASIGHDNHLLECEHKVNTLDRQTQMP